MKILSFILIFVVSISFLYIPIPAVALESEARIYISKTGEMWNDYVNMMNIVFPGGKIAGLYYHKLYAEYDAKFGGFVVREKVASHISYTKEVGDLSFGLCFSYNPEYKEGREFGKKNYNIWSKIRVGDVLYPNGIDFAKKTVSLSGSLKNGDLKTNSYFTVSFNQSNAEPTSYSDKKIVALGDSVTCNGGWTEAVSDRLGSNIINAGVSADRATEALLRFDKDVAVHSPDVVLITLGINDCVQYYYSDETVIAFRNELMLLYEKCSSIGAVVVFITPNNIKTQSLDYDRYKEYGGLSECFPKFIDTIKEVAYETDSYLIDIYGFFDETENLLCDSVHPNKDGYDIFIREISHHLIEFADRICGISLEGFIATGKGEFEIKENKMYISVCTVLEMKKYFCNEISVYKDGRLISDEKRISNDCEVCWIDKKGIPKESVSIIII